MASKFDTPESHIAGRAKDGADRGRNRALVAGLVAVALVQGFALSQLIPLKEKIPYWVEVEEASGRVVASDRGAKTFTPDDNNKRYFIKEWVQSMFSMDQSRSRSLLLPKAKSMTRGKAIDQYSLWLEKDRTIERMLDKPELSRAVEIRSISFVPGAENVAIIRAAFRTAGVPGESGTEGRVITIHYALVPPQTDEEILRNPIGLFVTEFNVDNEVIQ